jgi:hypothetical protein
VQIELAQPIRRHLYLVSGDGVGSKELVLTSSATSQNWNLAFGLQNDETAF